MTQSHKPRVGMGVAPRVPETAFDRSVRERMALEEETRRLGELRQATYGAGPVWGILTVINRLWRWQMAPRLPVDTRSVGPVLRRTT